MAEHTMILQSAPAADGGLVLPAHCAYLARQVGAGEQIRIRWDGATGWSHLAIHRPGAGQRPVFLGFAHLRAPRPGALHADLAACGLRVLAHYCDVGGFYETWVATPRAIPAVVAAGVAGGRR